MVNIKDFKHNNKEFCNKFNETLDLYYRASSFLENKNTNNEQIEKFMPVVLKYTKILSQLMEEFKNITGEEMPERIILGGFILYNTMDY